MIDLVAYDFELILARMLSRIPDTLDKREGSIIYDALAPAAYELAAAYEALYAAYEDTFLQTAAGSALDSRCEELGLARNAAVKAVRKGVFSDNGGTLLDIALGSRFSALGFRPEMNFMAVEKLADGVYALEAETAGAAGNEYQGMLLAINHIEGLGEAMLADILIPGEEEENDDDLRSRAVSLLQKEVSDGNAAQYLKWAAAYDGIGRAKVFPCWDGGNTVRVSILNSLNQKASAVLVDAFQLALDPGAEGLGNGLAPIGAMVTVSTAAEQPIAVSAAVVVTAGYGEEGMKAEVRAALAAFFTAAAYEKSRLDYIEIGAVVLGCDAVAAVSGLTVNGGQDGITLGEEEIAVLGDLSLTVEVAT